VIKYLGSKRTLVPVLGAMAAAVDAGTAVDLFTGTTRVAQEFKRLGMTVTASDIATYSEVLSDCYIATDATAVPSAPAKIPIRTGREDVPDTMSPAPAPTPVPKAAATVGTAT